MPINPPQYNLSPAEAIARLREEAAKHRAQEPDPILDGIAPDEIWVLGYETAIHDYLSLTGPNPREVGIVYMTPEEAPSE